MSGSTSRLRAIIRTDVVLRMRRTSTIVIFLLLSGFAYLWVPDVSTGRTLLQIDGHRVLYNSAALGMATAMIATTFVGLFAFYILSNTIRRDLSTRCGYVIASTNVRGSEYLLAKFTGNVLFLSLFIAGFMLTAMGMQLVRGEAPLQPLIFIGQYLMLVPPMITFVSAIAILFESVKWLSGKLGDVAYFFLWMVSMGVVGSASERGESWPNYFDFGGMSIVFAQLKTQLGTDSFSIGASPFDATKAAMVFDGLAFESSWILSRIISTLIPLALLPLALFFFHRFDPARVRSAGAMKSGKWFTRLNQLVKPAGRLLWSVTRPRAGRSLLNSIIADGVISLTLMPMAAVAVVGVIIASAVVPDVKALQVVVMVAIGAAGIAVSDIVCRERRSGTEGLAFAASSLRERFVFWKLGSSMLVAFLFVMPAVIRATLLGQTTLALAATVGSVLVAALAVLLGVLSGTPKTFMLVFLSSWYIALNDRGANPWLDFAGFNGASTPQVAAIWLAVAIASTVVAEVGHRRQIA